MGADWRLLSVNSASEIADRIAPYLKPGDVVVVTEVISKAWMLRTMAS